MDESYGQSLYTLLKEISKALLRDEGYRARVKELKSKTSVFARELNDFLIAGRWNWTNQLPVNACVSTFISGLDDYFRSGAELGEQIQAKRLL